LPLRSDLGAAVFTAEFLTDRWRLVAKAAAKPPAVSGLPEIILMDEATSALDPKSTEAIEDLVQRLKIELTLVLVTHNLAQARRLTDWLACVCLEDGAGRVVESACCDALFENPRCIDY
jgi:ABC-type phosphate transport system ATPase subunit